MNTIWNWLRAAFAGIGAGLGYFLGGCDGFFYALIAFTAVDYLTGVMCAIVDKKLSSAVGFKGIFRKILIFVMVGIGHTLDAQVLGGGDVLRTSVIFFYCANEGLSILENAGHLGLPIPAKLKSVLEQLHNRAEKTDEKEDGGNGTSE
ncbi:MAG: phage holin family protein [Clostridia bacterium]|nr:phage holin family protein [Clostridia bacterium]